MILDYEIIGKRIQKIRRGKRLTQAKLAEMCNLSVSYISYIESSGRDVSLESLVKLANNLGVTVDTFLRGYQKHDVITYEAGVTSLFEDCSCYERQIIYEIAMATKKSLRKNKINLTTCQIFDM